MYARIAQSCSRHVVSDKIWNENVTALCCVEGGATHTMWTVCWPLQFPRDARLTSTCPLRDNRPTARRKCIDDVCDRSDPRTDGR